MIEGALAVTLGTIVGLVLGLTGAVRINYALFGNLEPALHAHVFPRYADEPGSLRTANPWGYDWAAARRYDPALDGELQAALRERLAASRS